MNAQPSERLVTGKRAEEDAAELALRPQRLPRPDLTQHEAALGIDDIDCSQLSTPQHRRGRQPRRLPGSRRNRRPQRG